MALAVPPPNSSVHRAAFTGGHGGTRLLGEDGSASFVLDWTRGVFVLFFSY